MGGGYTGHLLNKCVSMEMENLGLFKLGKREKLETFLILSFSLEDVFPF